MSTILSNEAYEAWKDDLASLVPEGDYRVRILSVEPKDSNPNVLCIKHKIMSGPQAGRQLSAWPNIAPDLVWTFKNYVKEVAPDPANLQFEDLEGHIFMAHVTVETRKDNGEKINRVERLTPWVGDEVTPPPHADKEDLPF